MDRIIELRDVSTIYEGEKKPAIKNIDLSISENEFVYVIGPNACGKTTLLETIIGLLQPSQGEVYVLGCNMRKNGAKIRQKIGYVPQDFLTDPNEPFTALDVVMMGMFGKIGLLRKVNNEHKYKALKIMEKLGIRELANSPIGKLSGGQQQKVMIARALAKEPKILLLDEPFSNLDIKSKQKILRLIHKFHQEKGLTTIIVTHEISQVLMNKNNARIIVMNEGRIVAEKTIEEFLLSVKEYLWLPQVKMIK